MTRTMDTLQAAVMVRETLETQDDLGARLWAPNGTRGPVRVYVWQVHPKKGRIDLGWLEILPGVGPAVVNDHKLDKWKVKVASVLAFMLTGLTVTQTFGAPPVQQREDEDGNPLAASVSDRAGDET